MRIILAGGANLRRSPIAGGERCVNLYIERNGKKGEVTDICYQRPGMVPRVVGPSGGEVRGAFKVHDGRVFVVIGNRVYLLGFPTGMTPTLTPVGTIETSVGRVAMYDNRNTLALVDGTTTGYTYDLFGTDGFGPLVDGTGSFQGGNSIGFVDGFMLFPTPASNQFISSLDNVLTFDPTYVAGLTGDSNNLTTIGVLRNHIYLFGEYKTEIWYDSGNAGFPFARLPYVFIEHGTRAFATVAVHDVYIYFLANNRQGEGLVLRLKNYTMERISNETVETVLGQAIQLGADMAQAKASIFQMGGHVFYVLTIPAAPSGNSPRQTWAFDEATQEWTQWAWGPDLAAWPISCVVSINGIIYAGHESNGTLYQLAWYAGADDTTPIRFIRGFPHLANGVNFQGQPVATDGHMLEIKKFTADFDAGTSPVAGGTIILRYSSDRGHTWGEDLLHPAGDPGEYLVQPMWRINARARDVQFELEWSSPTQGALLGAWVEAEVLGDT